MSDYQCPSCGGICKKSRCERADVSAKTLTDEEIIELANQHLGAFTQFGCCNAHIEGEIEFARAILRKAQEK